MTSSSPSMNFVGSPLVPPAIGSVRFDVGKSLWLWGMLLPGVFFGIPALTPRLALLSLLLTLLSLCVGHSVGLHRGVIHRTYEASPLVRALLAYLFIWSGLGGPLSWARLHAVRDYWQNRADCPSYFAYRHSLLRDFVWNLHLRFEPNDDRADQKLPVDVLGDPWLRLLERSWPLHVAALAAVVFVVGGPDALAVCICARTAAGLLGHWAVGYASHKWGDQPFIVAGAHESGTNSWMLGALSFGEGFHNNHHAHPSSARLAMRAFDVDLGWWVVCVLERLRLVHQVQAWHRRTATVAAKVSLQPA